MGIIHLSEERFANLFDSEEEIGIYMTEISNTTTI